jgi:hypothetical protein
VVSVSVRVALPMGVSTRWVVVSRERSVLDSGRAASIVTWVDDVLAGGEDATTVSFSFTTSGPFSTTVVGSFTTVVEEVLAGRSQPASATSAAAIAAGRTYLIDVSMQ